MNITNIITACVAGMAMVAMALDNVEVTDVKARQRYPWNGKVDIDFTLDSKPTEPYFMRVEVYDNVGKTNLPVKSVCTEGVSVESNPCMVRTDTRRIVWDAAKDLPNGFKCTNVLVTCHDERMESNLKRYMILDLSSYSISYTNCPPAEGWTDEYKRGKIVFRKIPAGTSIMGTPEGEAGRVSNETLHKVKISLPYYIAIFPLTCSQCYRIMSMGSDTLSPAKLNWGSVRGWDISSTSSGALKHSGENASNKLDFTVTQSTAASDYGWPDKTAVDPASLVGKLRSQTTLKFDLPTEAQWEMACRGGTLTSLNIGYQDSSENRKPIETENLVVGSAMPNAWGLYDMLAANGEWCLDVYSDNLGSVEVTNPVGPALSGNTVKSVIASSVKIWELASSVNWAAIQCVYDGKTYSKSYYYRAAGYGTPVYLTCNAYGCRRVVKGKTYRSAGRTYGFNINPNLAIIKSGVTCRRVLSGGYYEVKTYKLSYSNNSFAVRLCVPVE